MDRMTGGRFFLGLGTSGRLVIEDFPRREVRQAADADAGIHRHHPQGRTRRAARPRREFFHTKRFQLRFTPHRASLPIYIASLSRRACGSPASSPTAGCRSSWRPHAMAAAVVELKAGAAAAGRSLSDIGQSRPRCRSTSPTTRRRPATASGRTSPSTSAAWASSITSTCAASASARRRPRARGVPGPRARPGREAGHRRDWSTP